MDKLTQNAETFIALFQYAQQNGKTYDWLSVALGIKKNSLTCKINRFKSKGKISGQLKTQRTLQTIDKENVFIAAWMEAFHNGYTVLWLREKLGLTSNQLKCQRTRIVRARKVTLPRLKRKHAPIKKAA